MLLKRFLLVHIVASLAACAYLVIRISGGSHIGDAWAIWYLALAVGQIAIAALTFTGPNRQRVLALLPLALSAAFFVAGIYHGQGWEFFAATMVGANIVLPGFNTLILLTATTPAAVREPLLARTRLLGKVLRFFTVVHLTGAFALSGVLIFGLLQVYYARGRFEIFDDAPAGPVILAMFGATAGMLLTALISRRPAPIAVSALLHPLGYALMYLSLPGEATRWTRVEELSIAFAVTGLVLLFAGDLQLLLSDRLSRPGKRAADVSRAELASTLRHLIVDQSQGSAKARVGRFLHRVTVGWIGGLWIPLALTFLVAQLTGFGAGGGPPALILWIVFILAFAAVAEPAGNWLIKRFPLADMPTEGINEAALAERLESGGDFGILLRAFGPYSTLPADIAAVTKGKFFAVEDARIGGHALALSTIWIPWKDWQAIVHPLMDHASMVVFDLTSADRSGAQLAGLKDELVYAKSRKYVDKTLVVTGAAALSRQDLRELIEGFVVHEQKPSHRFLPGVERDSERHKLRTSLDLLAHHSRKHRQELSAG